MAYDLCWLGNAFKLLSGFSGTKLPKNVKEIGNVSDSNVNVYDFDSIHQELKQWKVPQTERNELENILDALKSSPPEEKRSLIEKGKAWIVKNQEFLGAGASVIRKALGM